MLASVLASMLALMLDPMLALMHIVLLLTVVGRVTESHYSCTRDSFVHSCRSPNLQRCHDEEHRNRRRCRKERFAAAELEVSRKYVQLALARYRGNGIRKALGNRGTKLADRKCATNVTAPYQLT